MDRTALFAKIQPLALNVYHLIIFLITNVFNSVQFLHIQQSIKHAKTAIKYKTVYFALLKFPPNALFAALHIF